MYLPSYNENLPFSQRRVKKIDKEQDPSHYVGVSLHGARFVFAQTRILLSRIDQSYIHSAVFHEPMQIDGF